MCLLNNSSSSSSSSSNLTPFQKCKHLLEWPIMCIVNCTIKQLFALVANLCFMVWMALYVQGAPADLPEPGYYSGCHVCPILPHSHLCYCR